MEMLYLRNFLSTFFFNNHNNWIIFRSDSEEKTNTKKTKYRAQAFSARPWFTATTH